MELNKIISVYPFSQFVFCFSTPEREWWVDRKGGQIELTESNMKSPEQGRTELKGKRHGARQHLMETWHWKFCSTTTKRSLGSKQRKPYAANTGVAWYFCVHICYCDACRAEASTFAMLQKDLSPCWFDGMKKLPPSQQCQFQQHDTYLWQDIGHLYLSGGKTDITSRFSKRKYSK